MISESFDWDDINEEVLVDKAFELLRKRGFQLGMDEYLAGLTLIAERDTLPFVQDLDGLKQSLKLLWCSSQSEQEQFEPIWDKAVAAAESAAQVVIEVDESAPAPLPDIDMPLPERNTPEQVRSETVAEKASSPAVDATAQPVRAPFTPAEIDRPSDLQSYWPVSRRSMSYSWRYLRRTVAEGPADVVDVGATVQQTAQQGFYFQPVMQQSRFNRAQLLLFIDQNGSMMPLHQFTREIVETAQYESNLPEGQVTVCYFQNVPADYVYQDAFLKEPMKLKTVLEACDADTSVLIVSDGGAGRGYRRLVRIRETTNFLRKLRQVTQRFAWLNPVPVGRWQGSSAEMLAKLVLMFQMDDDGLSNAIDVVRGLQVQRG